MTKIKINNHTLFNYYFIIASIITLTIVVIRCIKVPLSHDEAATFFYFIQSGNYMPFYSLTDANNHILNSFLSNLFFHAFGSSPLSIRFPNVFGFIVLLYSIYKMSNFLNHLGSKIFITTALLFSFHWLTFFNITRGYGLSMAFLLLGILFFIKYINDTVENKYFYLALLAFQLAISSNLILIIAVLILSFIILIIQISNKQLLKPLPIISWLIHLGLIYYWLQFSFYLQHSGALYYGEGESYWKTTFVTLIQLLLGFSSIWITWLLISIFLITIVMCFYVNKNIASNFNSQFKKPSVSFILMLILAALSIGFYLMHKVLGVNFPEDRTGLFFYLFFVLFISFTFDSISYKWNIVIFILASLSFMIHFLYYLNFHKHSLNTYETIPQRFYNTLSKAQHNSEERITIGGHRVRELFFGYMNYRNNGYLNPADPVELMQMNCDYYLGTKAEKKYYQNYYDEIDYEPDWGFVLLKRKLPIIKKRFLHITNYNLIDIENEYIDVYHKNDTVFNETKPLQAQINFTIEKIDIPTNTWVVFAINDSLDKQLYFKRYPLYWSGYDLNAKTFDYTLTMGNLPPKAKNIVVFFWNINKKRLSIKVNELNIYQLEGYGVGYQAPDIK